MPSMKTSCCRCRMTKSFTARDPSSVKCPAMTGKDSPICARSMAICGRIPEHAGVKRLIGDLNRVYRRESALHQVDFSPEGFEWVDVGNAEMSVIAFLRKSADGGAPLLVVCNFTPVPRENFLVGVPARGLWREIINTDAQVYGGAGWGNLGAVESVPVGAHGRVESVSLTLPPLATLVLRWEGRG